MRQVVCRPVYTLTRRLKKLYLEKVFQERQAIVQSGKKIDFEVCLRLLEMKQNTHNIYKPLLTQHLLTG
jgi:hypothetical protein